MVQQAAIIALRNGGEEWRRFVESGQPLDFSGADLTTCDLDNREFPRSANFDRATFNRVTISSAPIHETITFKNTKFKQLAQIRPHLASPAAKLVFSEAEFFGDVIIDGRPAQNMNLVFDRAKFHGALNIITGGQHGKIDFTDAKFICDVDVKGDNGELIFTGARFGVEKPITASFRTALAISASAPQIATAHMMVTSQYIGGISAVRLGICANLRKACLRKCEAGPRAAVVAGQGRCWAGSSGPGLRGQSIAVAWSRLKTAGGGHDR